MPFSDSLLVLLSWHQSLMKEVLGRKQFLPDP